jgi:glycerophosphoryl diester phosphodiesterase
MKVYGHRGYARLHHENTAAAVRDAFDAGAYGVEIDVRRTADGLLVCCHAVHDGRTIVESPRAGLALDSLTDVLDAARGRVICEVKNLPGEPDFDAPTEATAKLLIEALATRDDSVTVSSFDWFAAEAARDAGLRAAFLAPPGIALEATLAYVDDAALHELHPHWTSVVEQPELVERAHEHGREVVVWTVDDPDVARQLRGYGVDGVITNDVPSIRAALDDD